VHTVSIFKNGKNQTIHLPADMADEGSGELATRSGSNALRPDWLSLADVPRADDDFLRERPVIVNLMKA